jgi:hypothetical protein
MSTKRELVYTEVSEDVYRKLYNCVDVEEFVNIYKGLIWSEMRPHPECYENVILGESDFEELKYMDWTCEYDDGPHIHPDRVPWSEIGELRLDFWYD